MSRSRRHRPVSPFPQEYGIDAMRISLPHSESCTTIRDHLVHRLSSLAEHEIDAKLVAGDVATADGEPVDAHTPYVRGGVIFVRREFAAEPVVPFEIPVIHEDERILVVDKPPFLATMPRGSHITQTVVARLRDSLGLPLLSPAHRLDRLTSGVLVLTKQPRWRGPYQQLFARRAVHKRYLALARPLHGFAEPADVAVHLVKVHGEHATKVIADREPNAHTVIALIDRFGEHALYRLEPTTGRTHQLRATMSHLGAPILGDPLYPREVTVARDDFSTPLQLLAASIRFVDPVTQKPASYRSARRLPVTE